MPNMVTKQAGSGVPTRTPAPSGNTQSVSAPNQSSDAQASQQLETLQKTVSQLTNDINRLKSSADRRLAQERANWMRERAELQSRLQQTATQNMDDAGKVKYEQDMLKLRLEQTEAELKAYQEEQTRNTQREQYVEMFAQYGVKREELDLSSDEALAQSGWEAVGRHVQELQSELALVKTGQAPATANPATPQPASSSSVQDAPVAPPVFTGVGTSVPQGVRFDDIRKDLVATRGRPVSDEEVFKEMDRGRIDPSQIIP